jgi:Rrf2 family cysteine metabolism transcriptional repressor
MRLSSRSEYGLRALVALAHRDNALPVPLRLIAEEENISEQYLEQIFVELRRAGFVSSVRGAKGGYRLARDPESIVVGDVVRLLEGTLAPMDCLIEDGLPCVREEGCRTRLVWQRIQSSIEDALGSMTLAEAAGEPQAARAAN